MRKNITLNESDLVCSDDSMENIIKDAMHLICDNQQPSQSTLRYIMQYAAAYESVESELLGRLDIMKN